MLHPYNYANLLRSLFVLSSVKIVPPPATRTASLAYIHSQVSTQPSSLSMTTPTPQWLQERLTTLLSSPHISMPSHIGSIRLGHGPIDLFSTRFTNMFTSDAVGIVAGQEVDKEGLKQALLALQKKWDPESTKFVAADSGSQQTATRFAWTTKDLDQQVNVTAAASTSGESGSQRISSLTLDGDESLFTK